MLQAEVITIDIERDWQEVYEAVADLRNFPKWAKTFCRAIKKLNDGDWYEMDTPQGPTRIRIASRNDFGVVDHYLVSPKGEDVYVPMRVISNGDGCQLQFTLFRRPGMTEEMFKSDKALVEKDLGTLKEAMEKGDVSN